MKHNKIRRSCTTEPSFPFFFFLILVAFGIQVTSGQTLPSPGQRDRSFGRNGLTSVVFQNQENGFREVILQPDGKVIAVSNKLSIPRRFQLFRFNPNGTLDETFGEAGITTDWSGPNDSAFATSAALQADGKIVVGGGFQDIAIARYNQNGSLDASFGDNGISRFDFSRPRPRYESYEQVDKVYVLPDGKIFAVGLRYIALLTFPYTYEMQLVLLRFNADGSIDDSFGSSGVIFMDFELKDNWIDDVLRDDLGYVFVTTHGITNCDLPCTTQFGNTIFKFQPDGTLDQSFAVNGVLTTGSSPYLNDVVGVATDGTLFVSGEGKLFRYSSAGAPISQTLSGERTIDGTDFVMRDFKVQNNGSIVCRGYLRINPWFNPAAFVRFLPEGSVDTSFGNSGVARGNFFVDSDFEFLLQPDGKILDVGRLSFDPVTFGLARYHGDTPTKFSKVSEPLNE